MQHPFTLPFYGIPSRSSSPNASSARPYVTSPILNPYALAAIRAVMGLYCFTTIISGFSWLAAANHSATVTLTDIKFVRYLFTFRASFIGQSFSQFTFLSYWSLGFYFAISAFHTFDYARSRARRGQPSDLWLQRSFAYHWGFELAYSLWHTSVTTYPFLVTTIFWGTMYGQPWPDTSFMQWINLSIHALNSLFALCEIIFCAVGPPKFVGHLLVLAVIMSLYLGLAYLSKVTINFYPYAWMNPQFGKIRIVAHVFGYAGGLIGIYIIVWGLKWMKTRVVARRQASNAGSVAVGETAVYATSEISVSTEEASESEKKDLSSFQIRPLDAAHVRPNDRGSEIV